MKTISIALLTMALTMAGPVAARTVGPSPLLGSWAVEVEKLPIPPEARPKSVTLTFTQSADQRWSTRVVIIGGDGSERRMSSSYTTDGTPVKIDGDTQEADTAAVRLPTPDVLILALGKGGIPASTRIYALAPGGNEMIETAVYFGDDGKPVMRTNHFTRIGTEQARIAP